MIWWSNPGAGGSWRRPKASSCGRFVSSADKYAASDILRLMSHSDDDPSTMLRVVLSAQRHVGGRRSHRRAVKSRARGNLRSEEHTSELQSRLHLVCRLLLEKKKKKNKKTQHTT